MFTLNQIIKEIKTFTTNHLQLKEFYEGDIWEYATGKDNQFAVLICTILGNSVILSAEQDGAADKYKFQIGVFDKLRDDYVNKLDVLNDTNLICKDFIAYFKNNPNLGDLNIDVEIGDLVDYTDRTDNNLAGWFFDFTITSYNPLDRCEIPTA